MQGNVWLLCVERAPHCVKFSPNFSSLFLEVFWLHVVWVCRVVEVCPLWSIVCVCVCVCVCKKEGGD